MRYVFDAVGFSREQLGWDPDPVQAAMLSSPKRQVILNWGRQCGKTTIASVKLAHTAITMPGTTSVWVSARVDHTAEVFATLEGYCARLGIKTRPQKYKNMAVVLPNGSRVMGLAAMDATVRSYAVNLLVVDEAAQVKDAVYVGLSPLLAVRAGMLWMLGTPRGKIGRFWEIWNNGSEEEWLKSERKTLDSGRVTAKFLESEKATMGADLARREYECEFLDDGRSLLKADHVYKLFKQRRDSDE